MYLVEQYTIDCEYLAYFLPNKFNFFLKNQKSIFFKRDIMQLFSADGTMFFKEITFFAHKSMEKTSLKSCSKSATIFFSVLPTGPKSPQISYSVPKKCLPAP